MPFAPAFRNLGMLSNKPMICLFIPSPPDPSILLPFLNRLEQEQGSFAFQVLVFDNHSQSDMGSVKEVLTKNRWLYYRAPYALTDSKFRWWVYRTVRNHTARYYIRMGCLNLEPESIPSILTAWDRITDEMKGTMSIIPSECPSTEVVQTCGDSFVISRTGIEVLSNSNPEVPFNPAERLKEQGFHLYQIGGAVVPRPEMQEAKEIPPAPVLLEKATPLRLPVRGDRIAAFFVATHNRPNFLHVCLQQLTHQIVPAGWAVKILVAGQTNDPGKEVALSFPGVQYVEVVSPLVTEKLNACLQATDAEMVMKADDDDLQVPNRAIAAIRAFEGGAVLAGSGKITGYDMTTDKVMQWVGDASRGLIGTTMSYSTKILRMVNGWPKIARGEDGPLATKIRRGPQRQFADLTAELEKTVMLQHGTNLYPKPVLEKGHSIVRGGFKITGCGTLAESDILETFKKVIPSLSLNVPKHVRPHPLPPPPPPPPPPNPAKNWVKTDEPFVVLGKTNRNLLLSVLICSLTQRKPLLDRLLEKLIPQLTSSTEVLVGRDGGKLSTGEKRQGLVQMAGGEYVCFVDDDDLVADCYIEKILKALQDRPDCCGIEGIITFSGKNPRKFIHSIQYKNWFEKNGVYYRCPNHINPIKKSIALMAPFKPITIGEDRDFSTCVQPHLKTEVYIPEPLYFYLS